MSQANASTWWITASNIVYVLPCAVAFRYGHALRGVGTLVMMCISSVYHYSHETEHQPNHDAYFNGFTDAASLALAKADTVLSLWLVAAGASLFLLDPRASRTFLLLDTALLLVLATYLIVIVMVAGYNRCAKGIQECSSHYLMVYYVVGVLVTLLAYVLVQRSYRVDPLGVFRTRLAAWGRRGTGAFLFSILGVFAAAVTIYAVQPTRDWHGVWHILSAVSLALALAWNPDHKDVHFLPLSQDVDSQ